MRIKADVVRRDERESGLRAVLNFGHTVAHAIETVTGYRWSHGSAVAVGMVVEARLAVEAAGFEAGSWPPNWVDPTGVRGVLLCPLD